jgi:4,5-DOPA dioxygenase extradiol
MTKKTPVYFISHGGPNLFEDYTHPAYAKLQQIGLEITQQVRPKAILVLSAHWQGSPKGIQVNTAASQPLIYDYYGFPPHYYKVQYPNAGSPELANRILSTLQSSGIEAEGVTRGLDHGVFAPFLVAFDPEKNPLGENVPIVQVSLFDSDSAEAHLALGKALEPLREEGVLIICSGMAVHNLRDLMSSFGKPGNKAYTLSFDSALKEAVEQDGAEAREKDMVALLRRSDARRAHPSFEHLLPVHVAAGAAGGDLGRQLWTLPEGSMSWAQFRFGDVAAAGGEGGQL